MDFNNNPLLYPKESGLNPMTPIIERINTLEGITKNYGDSFETKELNVTENAQIENLHATEGTVDTLESTNATVTNLNATNADIENAEVEKLDVTEEIKVENLKTEEPILSNAVVGYDENGKIIPIRIVAPTESSLYFDYTVDSQQKFDDLLSILKSGTPNTYRSIAILGGLGDGEHGEYLYTVDSDSGEANFNNASFIGFNNPKIVITADDADTFKVFKNGVIKDIDFNVGGTVVATETVTLLYNCTYDNGKIGLNETSGNFDVVNTTLSNIVNDVCKSFSGCTLNDFTNNSETTFTSCELNKGSVTDSCIFTSCELNKGSVTDSCIFTSCELNDYTINGNGTFTSCNFTDGSVNGICTFTSCNLDNILIDYACTFTSSTLKDCKNTKYSTFEECSLNFCDTVQSVFDKCNSEMLYVSTDANIVNKYSFNKCGIHLDMKKADMTQVETVTINIASMTDSKLSVLDASSNLKKIVLNVDASDSLSEIIGNNDKKYSIYEPFVRKVYKSVSPSMRDKAYLCVMDSSHTPIFSNNGINFYIDEAMTKEVKCFYTFDNERNPKCAFYFTLASDTNTLYSSLTLNKEVTDANTKYPQLFISLKMSELCDEFILNETPLKIYICMNDESGTLLYSNDSGTTLYISPYISSDTKISYIKDNLSESDTRFFMLGTARRKFAENLNVFDTNTPFEEFAFVTPKLLEVTALKDNYAVQVVSDYDVPIYVENAFNTKVKND